MSRAYTSHTLTVDGLRTQYLEAGEENDETVVLIHSGEYGASAEMSWQQTIPALAEHYHVLAPDLLGYGGSAKVFDFEDMFDRRVRHVSAFLELLTVENAYFVGNSMGAGYLGSLACEEHPLDWPIQKMILISGGGTTPPGFVDIIRDFDGSEEGMRTILDALFYDPEQLSDEYVRTKVENSRRPGHWQSLSAIRFEAPFEQDRQFRRQHNYENVDVPTLIIGGEEDELHPRDELEEVAAEIGAETRFFEECKHSAHIEHAEAVNELILEFFADAAE
ncbi:alpha/beta fold hydrolase [Halobellus sp. GM3]|uniref:alpha/beta fold hydrolase n=1 Tax=Halobellus sp. GM3 TaxID=3458410 RepID=UPI00403D81C3